MRPKLLGHPLDCNCLGRRNFLKVVGGAALAGITGGSLFVADQARADALSKEMREKLTPEQILQIMKDGNKRFRAGERQERNYLREQEASAKGQYPAAVLLTCIDSRAPAEVIMDLGIGDIFNCRVAGNVSNADILGSMEFACKVAGAKVALVMGHTACGAIKGAIDNAELGNLTGLLAKIKPAIEATAYTGERSAKNYAFVDAVARKNVEMTVAEIRKQSPVLAEMEAKGEVKMASAMYNLETGAVEFYRLRVGRLPDGAGAHGLKAPRGPIAAAGQIAGSRSRTGSIRRSAGSGSALKARPVAVAAEVSTTLRSGRPLFPGYAFVGTGRPACCRWSSARRQRL